MTTAGLFWGQIDKPPVQIDCFWTQEGECLLPFIRALLGRSEIGEDAVPVVEAKPRPPLQKSAL